LSGLVDDVGLFEEKFFPCLFEESGANLKVKVLIWRFLGLFVKFEVRRTGSEGEFGQLFSKHYFLYMIYNKLHY
jgi:hypothetical protein